MSDSQLVSVKLGTAVGRPRLRGHDYTGRDAYNITFVTRGRARVLTGAAAAEVDSVLNQAAERQQLEVLAYVVMPDHVHALVQGTTDESNLIRFVQRFKQVTGFRHKQRAGSELWQSSFYDRAMRREDDVRVVARYIHENPVRAGLIDAAEEWRYRGGTLISSDDRRT